MGVTFTESGAAKIKQVVQKVLNPSQDRTGDRNRPHPTETFFWGMITGCDITGLRQHFVRVIPDASKDGADFVIDNGPAYRIAGEEPETGYARETNSYRPIRTGTVVLINFIGYDRDGDDRPISIIITTLAAKAYQRQANLYEALKVILRDMQKHLENRAGVWWVPNPVNPEENFADKWRDYPQRAEKFRNWIAQAQRDFSDLEKWAQANRLNEGATQFFGKGATERASGNLQTLKRGSTELAAAPSASEGVPGPADTSHRQPPPWPVQLTHRVTVTGSVHAKLYATKRLWLLRPFPINKSMGVKFVATTTVPPPFEVRWQVVNTGAAARATDVNCGSRAWL